MTVFTELLLQSLVLAVTGGCLLLLRRLLLKGREHCACGLTILLLILSVIPLRLIPSVTPLAWDRAAEEIRGNLADGEGWDAVFPHLPSNDAAHPEQKPTDSIKPGEPSLGEPSLPSQPTVPQARPILSPYAALAILWVVGCIGTILFTLIPMMRFISRAKRASRPCGDERMTAICRRAMDACGWKGTVRIRVMEGTSVYPPFVTGYLRPTVFLNPYTLTLSDERLELIFLHELCHVRYCHGLIKMFTLLVRSIHWFNPIAHRLTATVIRDLECCCDAAVLKRCGEEARVGYMETILDVAAAASKEWIGGLTTQVGGGFLASENKHELKRRLHNMKTKQTRSGRIRLAVAVAILLLISTVTLCFASCLNPHGASAPNADGTGVTTGIPPVDSAIRAYFRLTDDEPLTKEMLEAVTSLRISATSYTCQKEGYTLVSVRVNGKNEFGGVLEMLVDADRFEAMITKFTNESTLLKFSCFYVKKDPSDPTLSEEERQEILMTFPESVNGAIYVLDPTISMREYAGRMECLDRNELLDSKCIEGTVLNGALLNRLPNLTTVTLRGIEAENLPENVTVIREEYTKYDLNQHRFNLDDTPRMDILTIE